ncbi:MAG TPA: ThiF family adenylyltransferase [Pyrinomonadaceae bacterium]
MTDFPHWFEADPARLEHEREEYERQGLNFTLDRELFDSARVVSFKGSVTLSGGGVRRFEVVYPPAFPFMRPEVYSHDTSLERHQNPLGKNLCLLPNEEDEWEWDMTGAYLIGQAVRLLEDTQAGPSVVSEQEVPAPEPQVLYLGHLFSGALIIPEQFQRIPAGASGSFAIQALSLDPWRALLSHASVSAGPNTESVAAPEQLIRIYGQAATLRGAWFKAERMPDPASARDFESLRRWALNQRPALENTLRRTRKQTAAGAREIELIGVVFTDEGPERGQTHETWVVLASWKGAGGVARTHVLRPALLSEHDRFSRAPQLAGLRRKGAVIFGLGAVGSTVAIQLARAGIGRLHLVDADVVEPPNLVRHETDLHDVGVDKVSAVGFRVMKVNPFTELEYSVGYIGRMNPGNPYAAADHLQQIAKIVSDYDMIIAATGGGGFNHMINRIALHAGRPALFAWVTNGAWGGRVIRMIPGRTGCYECAARALPAVEPDSDPDAPAVYGRGCGFPSFTGTGFDIASISLLATRLAVQTLLRDETGGYPDAPYDHIVWQNRADGAARLPEISHHESTRIEECRACGRETS